MTLEHSLDRFHVRLADSAKYEIDLAARSVRADVLQQQLRDNLVGAREVEQSDVGEVDDGERAIADPVELLFDLRSNGGAGGSCYEVRIELADALPQHRAHIDVIDHATRSGIVICTCAPGKYGRFSRSGSSSSQSPLGSTAMRAVPLRMESLPSQFPTNRLTPARP